MTRKNIQRRHRRLRKHPPAKHQTEMIRLENGQIIELLCDEPGHQWHATVFVGAAENFLAEDRDGLLRVISSRHPIMPTA